MKLFNKLKTEEKEILLNSPSLVIILIAGADGVIDNKEISKAINVTKENAARSEGYLNSFYREVAENFVVKFHNLLSTLPDDTDQRNAIIVQRLSRLNEIFQKTDKTFSIVLYSNLRTLAVEIAKSSGGTLGMNSISDEELEFLDLPMIKDPSLMFC